MTLIDSALFAAVFNLIQFAWEICWALYWMTRRIKPAPQGSCNVPAVGGVPNTHVHNRVMHTAGRERCWFRLGPFSEGSVEVMASELISLPSFFTVQIWGQGPWSIVRLKEEIEAEQEVWFGNYCKQGPGGEKVKPMFTQCITQTHVATQSPSPHDRVNSDLAVHLLVKRDKANKRLNSRDESQGNHGAGRKTPLKGYIICDSVYIMLSKTTKDKKTKLQELTDNRSVVAREWG